MAPRKPNDDVQKVVIEDVSSKAKEAHEKAVSASVFSEKVMLAFFGAVVACATCFQLFLQFKTNALASDAASKVAEVAVQAEKIAAKAETVKRTLDATTKVTDEKLDSLEKVTTETHALVNSGSLVTLKLLAEVSRWKATQTKDPDHLKAAELAEQNVRDHEAKQAELDAKEKSTPPL